MRRNIFKEIKGDLWIVLLDAISVNAAWFISLLLRYYVHSEFLPSAMQFVTNYLHFAPFYTILCIVFFSEFGLYHGIWRNARFKDLGRIIGANVSTLILYILITSIVGIRLPFNVCILSTAIQLTLILIIRYSNRIVRAERWKREKRKGKQRNVMLVGDDVKARSMIKLLLADSKYKPVVIVGNASHTAHDFHNSHTAHHSPNEVEDEVEDEAKDESSVEKIYNIPVVHTDDFKPIMKEHDINCVIITGGAEKKEELESYCQKKDIEFIDYSVSPTKLLLTIPIFTLIRMFFRGLIWEFFYEWE